MIQQLDHVNIRTSRLEEMTRWYVEVLGLRSGYRPNFPFPGAWLYAGEMAVVHLVAEEAEPSVDQSDLKIEHAAFRAKGYDAFIARLDAEGAERRVIKVPGVNIVQVNIWDPDGNHLHIDFESGEAGQAAEGDRTYP